MIYRLRCFKKDYYYTTRGFLLVAIFFKKKIFFKDFMFVRSYDSALCHSSLNTRYAYRRILKVGAIRTPKFLFDWLADMNIMQNSFGSFNNL